MTELYNAITISTHGMKAQGTRIRVISENLANSDTAAATPSEDPYTRKTITFKNVMDRQIDANTVEVSKIRDDRKRPYPVKFMPDHPGADENGYVKMPNVNTLVEMMDMREAQRSYEANLGMLDQSRGMVTRTIDLMRQ
jgi:flagellar basal-body rod protein FlgC